MLERIDLGPTNQLRRAGLALHRGWSDELALQLVERSREPEQRKKTPSDTGKQFYDLAGATEWFDTTQPIVYSLARAAQLTGAIWYSRQERTDIIADYTLETRMYDTASGKDYIEPFTRAADADFRAQYAPQAVWVNTETGDSETRELYFKLGYGIAKATNAFITMRR